MTLSTSAPRFAGIYGFEYGYRREDQAKMNRVERAIREEADRQGIPVMTEELVEGGGEQGDPDVYRVFYTGKDCTLRQLNAAKRKAIADILKQALEAATDTFHRVKDDKFKEARDNGTLTTFDEVDTSLGIDADFKVKGFEEKLSVKRPPIRHNLLSHFVYRFTSERGETQRTNLLKAVKSGDFDVESGKFKDTTPFEPADYRWPANLAWFDEPEE